MYGVKIQSLLKRFAFEEVSALLQKPTEVEFDDQLRDYRDEDGFSIFHWAAMAEHIELMLFCIDHLNMDVDIRGTNLQTPFLWAAMDERLLAMTLLLDRGADLNAKDDLGDNALTLAAQHEKFHSCLFLLSRGVDVNTANVTGSTAAHWAAFSGAYLLLALLESANCDMKNSYDRYGMLPLHRALQLEYYATARMLVTFDKTLLDCKTKDGLDLHEFANKYDISAKWFGEFLALCEDPRHKLKVSQSTVTGGASSICGASRRGPGISAIRDYLWNKLADTLASMEENRLGRLAVPAIAFVVALVFYLTWKHSLSEAHSILLAALQRYLPAPVSFVTNNLLRLIPIGGLLSVAIFSCLLLQDPGVVPATNDRAPLFKTFQDKLNDVRFLWNISEQDIPMKNTRCHKWLRNAKGVPLEVIEGKSAAARQEARGKIDGRRICPTCWVHKGLRTKHCSICDQCCEVMDHHCVWINGCVGRRNHRTFLLFTVLAGHCQLYHAALVVFVTALVIATRIFGGWSMYKLPLVHPLWWQAALLTMSASIHFVTTPWSVALLTSQISDVCEGLTINESLSVGKYQHFVVPVEWDTTAEDAVATSQNERDISAERDQGHATTVLDAEGIGKEVIEATTKFASDKFTRRFVRNPFTLDRGRVRNCIDFWLDRVPVEIDYQALEKYDATFVADIRRKIEMRRSTGGTDGSRLWTWAGTRDIILERIRGSKMVVDKLKSKKDI